MAYVSNAWKQSKRGGPKNDSPATAGVGKLPGKTVTNKKELEELGERMGWKARPLTEKEIKGEMSGQELIWHETFSSTEVEKALSFAAIGKHNDDARKQWGVKRIWEGKATPEEHQKAVTAAAMFAAHYPQFIRSDSNTWAVTNYLADRNLDPTQLSNYIEAFEHLLPQGKLAVNPSAIGAGSETELYDVSKHRNYHLLLQAQRRPSDVDRMSADQFKAARPELADTRVPFIVAVRQERAANNAAHVKTTETVTASSGSTKVVDYPPTQHGVPAQAEKVSFRKKINSMTADQIQQECAINPGFRKSLDELK